MHFGCALPLLIQHIFWTDPYLGLIILSKFYLSYMQIHVWICPEDIYYLSFVFPPHPSNMYTFIGFHLSLMMGYMDITHYF